MKMNHDEIILGLRGLVEKFTFPEKFEDTSQWFSGDGPYEDYCNDLAFEAEKFLNKIDYENEQTD